MYQIEISFEDQTYIRIDTSKSIESELYEYFSFRIPNWRFDPRVKRGLWDGYIHLYNYRTKTIYRGLLPDVISFCKDRGYAYNLESSSYPKFDLSLIDYISENLIEDKTLREDQRRAIEYALTTHRSLVESPTGCFDPDTMIEVILDEESKKILNDFRDERVSLTELEYLVSCGVRPKILTPSGYEYITHTYRKYSPGKQIDFTDSTSIRVANKHLILDNGKWIYAEDIAVGQKIDNKEVRSILDIEDQEWIDFTINADHHSYLHEGLIHHNSGKSLILYVISMFYALNDVGRILIVVPTTTLVEQMYKDFIDYHKGDKKEFAQTIQRISGEYDKTIRSDTSICISTWQSIYKFNSDWFNQFNVLIGDEVHTFTAKSLVEIMVKSTNVVFRHGTTATLSNKDSKINILVLRGLFGEPLTVSSTKELMDKGILSKIEIHAFRLIYKDTKIHDVVNKLRASKKLSFQQEIKLVSAVKVRNDFIRKLALSVDGNCMLMFSLVDDQGKKIYDDLVNNMGDSKKEIFYIDGNTKTEERERIRLLAEQRDDIIIVCSFRTFGTGINIRRIHHIICHTSYKASIIMKQVIGRGLRLHETKDMLKFYDFGDDFSVGKENSLFKHLKERLKLYRQEKFKVKIHEYIIEQGKITKKNASTEKK